MSSAGVSDVNTAEYWDRVWTRERDETWRTHPGTFDRIMALLYGLCENGPLKVVEIGCGAGVLAQTLARPAGLLGEYVGIDISDHCFGPCRERIVSVAPHLEGHLTFHACDVNDESPPLPPDWADVSICTETLEHLREDHRAVRCMVDLTRPGGYVIASVPHNCLGPDDESEHLRTYDTNRFAALFENLAWRRGLITPFEEWYAYRQRGNEHQVRRPTLLFVGQCG